MVRLRGADARRDGKGAGVSTIESAADVRELSAEAQRLVGLASVAFEAALPADVLAVDVDRWAVTPTAVLVSLTDGRLLAWYADAGWIIDYAAAHAVAYAKDGTVRASGSVPPGLVDAIGSDPTAN